jgi:hypothetical protein
VRLLLGILATLCLGFLLPPAVSAAASPDRKPPRTKIFYRPPEVITKPSGKRRIVIRFGASERNVSFCCRLDRGPFRPCTSPRTYSLARGRHAIYIRAIDAAGNADRTPAVVRVEVRRR